MKLDGEMKQVLDNSIVGIYIADEERRIVYWNQEAERISGRSKEDMIGVKCHEGGLDHVNMEGEHLCSSLCPYLKTYQDGKERSAKVFLRHKNGDRILVEAKFIPVFDDQHDLDFVMEQFREAGTKNVSDQMINQLSDAAQHDQLTGIPNRRFLDGYLSYQVLMRREIGQQNAVMFLDVDNFRKFNNTYGHEAGDLVLKELTKTVTSINRSGDVFGRWGGEEFMGFFSINDPAVIPAIAERYISAIRAMEISFEGQNLSVTASIGITCIREDDTPESVTKRADELMYHSKQAGKDRYTCG